MQLETLREHLIGKPARRGVVAIALLGFLAFLASDMRIIDPETPASSPSPAYSGYSGGQKASTGGVTESELAAIRSTFAPMGFRVELASGGRILYVHVSDAAAATLGKQGAQRVASIAYRHIKDSSVVYVKDPSGFTLAKASAWGLD